MNPSSIQLVAAVCFGLAIIHTFSTRFFEQLASRQPKHAGAWHLLGEVEIVFGFWATVLIFFMLVMEGKDSVTGYVNSLRFTEPMFVFAIMVIAASKPILQMASTLVRKLGALIPLGGSAGRYFCLLSVLPLLGSFITEPAAMTVAAMTLSESFYDRGLPTRVKYITLGVLFVNISIGGTLTHYAAPPVLMVAGKWGWTLDYMLAQFGWKATIAVVVNALLATLICRSDLKKLPPENDSTHAKTPFLISLIHLVFLCSVVIFAHTPVLFMGIFLIFLGFASAYAKFQHRLILCEGLLVAFFLAGLVVIGGGQQWWLQPLLTSMSDTAVFFGATALTSITDNAALTYLGSLVDGISDGFKYSLVAGAVVGGGLTVIANAPNPAGFSILRRHFPDGAISPLMLLLYAFPPTLIALVAFWLG